MVGSGGGGGTEGMPSGFIGLILGSGFVAVLGNEVVDEVKPTARVSHSTSRCR